jgi:hypothetical protein
VTDNRLYAHSLAKTVDQINNSSLQWSCEDTEGTTNVDNETVENFGNLRTKKISSVQNLNDSESDSDASVDETEGRQEEYLQSQQEVKAKSSAPPILVRSGDPEERGDHLETDEGSSSYFSRMWKNGSKSRVWNLVLVKR